MSGSEVANLWLEGSVVAMPGTSFYFWQNFAAAEVINNYSAICASIAALSMTENTLVIFPLFTS